MKKIKNISFFFFLIMWPLVLSAALDSIQRAVWVNEAIVATYTYDYKNYLSRQKEIAKYFTAEGWIAYSKALNESKLPEAIAKNSYFVSAVALLPPEVKTIAPTRWQATMPLLVIYKNPQYRQKQTLNVIVNFSEVPTGQGVRGLAINYLQTTIKKPPCECQPEVLHDQPASDMPPPKT